MQHDGHDGRAPHSSCLVPPLTAPFCPLPFGRRRCAELRNPPARVAAPPIHPCSDAGRPGLWQGSAPFRAGEPCGPPPQSSSFPLLFFHWLRGRACPHRANAGGGGQGMLLSRCTCCVVWQATCRCCVRRPGRRRPVGADTPDAGRLFAAPATRPCSSSSSVPPTVPTVHPACTLSSAFDGAATTHFEECHACFCSFQPGLIRFDPRLEFPPGHLWQLCRGPHLPEGLPPHPGLHR